MYLVYLVGETDVDGECGCKDEESKVVQHPALSIEGTAVISIN